ncbi:MAG: hypothetical protein M1822_005704 [Bathelium mastoideum]|nr:MAG: hypothetical protein M1822_005704 [Bathelium mastoideum]
MSTMLASTASERLPHSEFNFDNVAKMYNTLGSNYEDYIGVDAGRLQSVEWIWQTLSEQISDNGSDNGRGKDGRFIVDLGCAYGRPTVQLLAERLYEQSRAVGVERRDKVVGIDLSEGQINIARSTVQVPGASFEVADLRTWEPPEGRRVGGCDAVASFYVLNHLHYEDYCATVTRMVSWLKPGGLLVLGIVSGVNGKVKWLGFDVCATSAPLEENVKLVDANGCEVVKAFEEEWRSAGVPDSHPKMNQFIWARKR